MASRLPESEPVHPQSPVPVDRPVMLQGWHDLASVHWRYPPEVVQALLPDGYRVDTFDGSAWVGLLPFHMRRIRIPHLPAFGPLSTFPETNIRTYLVDRHGRRGVWFISLDVTRLLPALVARVSYPHRPLGPRYPLRTEAHVGGGRPSTLADPPRRTARGRRDPARSRRTSRTRGRPGRAVVPGRRRPYRDAPYGHCDEWNTSVGEAGTVSGDGRLGRDPVDEVSMRIDAPPEQIWDLITDVERMGELSPEAS